MLKHIITSAVTALALTASGAMAAGGGDQHIEDYAFSFEGPFGTYDQNQLQRGLKVYTEVCAACHGLKFVPFRTLADEGGLGYSEDQVRAYAAQFDVYDAELEDTRPA
ncbi:MAG: cytochrome c1, partial [Rhodobacteraceae bacterium]|nr:cytochrome c1 [Paracoccaceae bacterium]